MTFKESSKLFASSPRLSIFLALLCLVLGILSVNDIVPLSENRRYFVGHDWVLASISWGLAIFFGYSGFKGLRSVSSLTHHSGGTPNSDP